MTSLALRASRGGLGLLVGIAATLSTGLAQTPPATRTGEFLHAAPTTRIADPKLQSGRVEIGYQLDPGRTSYDVTIALWSSTGQELFQLYHNREWGTTSPQTRIWDGKDPSGKVMDPGTYKLRVEAHDGRWIARHVDYDLDLVRLGLTNIAAESSGGSATNEWQTVYFMKKKKYAFYATPATGEWLSIAEKGETSDLDLNDGSPRPAPAVHTKTDEPALELASGGVNYIYENDSFNYPLCYLIGSTPQFTVTTGATCTLSNGAAGSCNYPVAGFDLRVVASDEAGTWTTGGTSLTPGATETLSGPALPMEATRTERHLVWRFQYRPTGGSTWTNVPGRFETTHRIYTIIDHPYFATGATGTQYTGPWVEVLEYAYTFSTALSVTCDSDDRVVESFIKGFFGQNGSLTTAIEDVHYDCPGEGGDGGATHYHDWGSWTMPLSALLNAHANGKFVNCTDCASSTSVMLSMLGIPSLQMDHLGSMTLRAIWGIGTDDYTLDLWKNGGGSGHGFSYHHIITRDGGTTISDGCLWVDEDGSPDTLPGTPGFNNDRDWNNYESLVAKGNVSWFTEKLPKLQ
jgi:hypothetical protein